MNPKTSPPPTPRPGARLELRIESDPAQVAPARRAVEAMAQRGGLDAGAAGDVGLCVNEALANVIRHAYANAPGRPIVVTAEMVRWETPPAADDRATPNADRTAGDSAAGGGSGDALRVTVRDWGSGANPQCRPAEPYDPLEPGGVGLLCLRSLLHETIYTPQPDGMLLTMVRRKGPLPRAGRQ